MMKRSFPAWLYRLFPRFFFIFYSIDLSQLLASCGHAVMTLSSIDPLEPRLIRTRTRPWNGGRDESTAPTRKSTHRPLRPLARTLSMCTDITDFFFPLTSSIHTSGFILYVVRKKSVFWLLKLPSLLPLDQITFILDLLGLAIKPK